MRRPPCPRKMWHGKTAAVESGAAASPLPGRGESTPSAGRSHARDRVPRRAMIAYSPRNEPAPSARPQDKPPMNHFDRQSRRPADREPLPQGGIAELTPIAPEII